MILYAVIDTYVLVSALLTSNPASPCYIMFMRTMSHL